MSKKKIKSHYLLLDEPAAALDLFHQHHLFATLRKLAKQWAIGILVSTHDINLAITYADQLIWLKNGDILAIGTPEETVSPAIIETTFSYPVNIVHTTNQKNIVIPKKMVI